MSLALEVLKHYLDQRSDNNIKNRLKILEENYPCLNKSLFFIKKSNYLRKQCIKIVEFKLDLKVFIQYYALNRIYKKYKLFNFTRYSFFRRQFKKLNNFIYSLPVIDWIMILITLLCCSTLIFENPNYSILNNENIILIEYIYVITLLLDILVRLIGFGLFSPDAILFNLSFLIDLIVFINSIILIILHHSNFNIPLIILLLR